MAMQQNTSVMITDTALSFWFDTIQIKRVPEGILMRHIIIVLLLLFSLVAGLFSLVLLLNQRRPSIAKASGVTLQYFPYYV